MSDHTHIEWTDATWNPITGCSVVSAGCKHCYAMKLAGTRLQHHPSRAGLTIDTKAGPVWNGQVRFNREWLDQPLRWRRPRRIFVCAHGDLFHENVPDEWIDRVFAVMSVANWHQFQVLTKRAERMRAYCSDPASLGRIVALLASMFETTARAELQHEHDNLDGFFLPNVWLGVSVEDQTAADERIPHLLATPAAVRWISAEPLLGPIQFRWTPYAHQATGEDYRTYLERQGNVDQYEALRKLDWVVVGGESGTGARPMHPEWARTLRDQCADAGVAFLFKQWGVWEPRDEWSPGPVKQTAIKLDGTPVGYGEVPQDVGGHRFVLTSKRTAGRLLDGREWNDYPRPTP